MLKQSPNIQTEIARIYKSQNCPQKEEFVFDYQGIDGNKLVQS